MNLLIVEDEKLLGSAIEQGLLEAQHACEWVRNGAKGLELARSISSTRSSWTVCCLIWMGCRCCGRCAPRGS